MQFLLSAYSANVTVLPLLDDNVAIASSLLTHLSPGSHSQPNLLLAEN
ncbi:hypothetical protein [Coleofasciculus sp. H7-2]